MQRPSYYRDLAAQCVLMAVETSASEHKAALLDMARRWGELAEQAEIRLANNNGLAE